MAKYKPQRKLGRPTEHRFALLRNLATSLIKNEQIKVSEAKGKELLRFVEKIITWAKKNDLNARRRVARQIKDRVAREKLFSTLVPRYAERQGGYVRIFKIGLRASDGTRMSLVKLVS